ncbi:hypothetical protein HPB49_012207 [Dermacentor silvarum]|uniref:Uncharacterized protein n=1 Tax=Dermacentor silvarum TaxID=543639 RepID=A0ACB8CRA8_DERSI|nr:hypothetical protein HPB49_012207 [Dermacentor silvarum]
MPAKDFKVVCRHKNCDLSVVTPRELGSAMRAAAKLTSATAVEDDLVRVNETNNKMTMSTPCINRSGAYASVKTLKRGGRDRPVSEYVAAMENSVRGVIYNAYDGYPVEEIRAGFLKLNEGMEILDARTLGKSKAIQITFGGKSRKQPPGRQQSSEDKSQDGKEEQRLRPTERSSSGARDGNKGRDRSGSFPPLPGVGAGKAGERGSHHERSADSANDTTKKAPQKVAQVAGSRVQESTALEVENRGPVKRPPPADEGTNAKRVAETSTADTPQPAFKVTSLKADVIVLVDRVGKLEDRQDRLEARVGKIEARLDKIEEPFDTFTNESRAFQTQVMGMFWQLHTLLEARLPVVVGQAPIALTEAERLSVHSTVREMMVAVPVVPPQRNCDLGEMTSAQPAKRRLLDFQDSYYDDEAVAEVDELDTYLQSGGSSDGDGMDVLQ